DTGGVESKCVPIHFAGRADVAADGVAYGQRRARRRVHRDVAKQVGSQRIRCVAWVEAFNEDPVSSCHWQGDGGRVPGTDGKEEIARWTQEPKCDSLLRLEKERDLVPLRAGQAKEVGLVPRAQGSVYGYSVAQRLCAGQVLDLEGIGTGPLP